VDLIGMLLRLREYEELREAKLWRGADEVYHFIMES
jgi:hypothetical protein